MEHSYLIDGVPCVGENAVREYCTEFVKKGFKQDFRLIQGARTLPIDQLISLLELTGHAVEDYNGI